MSYVVKTVRIKTDAKDNPTGFYEINESDFDAKRHTLYQAPEPKKPEVKPAEVKTAPK